MGLADEVLDDVKVTVTTSKVKWCITCFCSQCASLEVLYMMAKYSSVLTNPPYVNCHRTHCYALHSEFFSSEVTLTKRARSHDPSSVTHILSIHWHKTISIQADIRTITYYVPGVWWYAELSLCFTWQLPMAGWILSLN